MKNLWSRDELMLAFNLYCRIPFGKMHKSNPDIIALAGTISRTPDAVAMKLVNFASLDPVQRKRGIRGLSHAGKEEKRIWEEFHGDWENMAAESQEAILKRRGLRKTIHDDDEQWKDRLSATESVRLVRSRLVQQFFREVVLASYESTCAVCSLGLPELLNASHIIPWSEDIKRRADPQNGIALCALHDRAFDRGLLSINHDYRILVSKNAKLPAPPRLHTVGLLDIEGQPLRLPTRFLPDPQALAFHREHVYQT